MPLDPLENTRSRKQWRKVRKEKRDAYLQAAVASSYPTGTTTHEIRSVPPPSADVSINTRFINSPRPLPSRGEDIFNRIRNDKDFLVLLDKILNDVSRAVPLPSQPPTGSQSVTSFLSKECPPSKRADLAA